MSKKFKSMPSKLDVFDFDGTIFNSPTESEENKLKYEKATGIPWVIDKQMSHKLTQKHGKYIGMRRGWWGRAETLEPPLVPSPVPQEWFHKEVCKAFENSLSSPECRTMIITGRYRGLKHQVFRILNESKLVKIDTSDKNQYRWNDENCNIQFLGDDGPLYSKNKPSTTFEYKIWVLEQCMELFPEIKTIEFWEDRAEHVEKFQELHGLLAENVIVNHIKF